jgi:DNA-binding XRE family transcriptional regulator
MTRTALARHVGVTRQTVYNWERAGMIPLGNRVSARRTVFAPTAVAIAESLVMGAGA